jgi:hypothetical protein
MGKNTPWQLLGKGILEEIDEGDFPPFYFRAGLMLVVPEWRMDDGHWAHNSKGYTWVPAIGVSRVLTHLPLFVPIHHAVFC